MCMCHVTNVNISHVTDIDESCVTNMNELLIIKSVINIVKTGCR